MAQFQRHFVQDLTEPIRIRQCGDLGFTGDNDSDVISVDLYTDGVEYSGGGDVAGACIRPDGSTFGLTGSISGKTASVSLKEHCFDIPGQIGIAIRVTTGTTKTTVLKAIYNVELFSTSNPVDPGSQTALDVGDLINQIDTAVESIPADLTDLKAALAPTFSTSTAYAIGQYVWYGGKLYKFTSFHAAGTWNSNHVAEASVGPDVSEINTITENISQKTANLWIYGDQQFVKNKSIAPFEIPAGTYTFSAVISNTGGVTRSRFYAFYENSANVSGIIDANGERASVTVTFTDKVVRIRLDAATTSGASEGITSTWQDIQIEQGSVATDYYAPYIAVDTVARKGVALNADQISNICDDLEANKIIKGVIDSSVYSSCDDIKTTGVYFKSSNSGTTGFPYTTGWLMVFPSTEETVTTYQYLQIAYAWNPANYKTMPTKYRVFASGAWSDWFVLYDRDAIDKIQTAIYQYNGYNILLDGGATSGTSHGITYTLNADNSWTINGVSDGSVSFRNLISSTSSVPSYIYRGRKYRCNISQTTATLAAFVYVNGSSTKTTLADNDILQIPDDMTGIVVRLEVAAGKTVTNETVFVSLVGLPDVEQNVTENTYNNNIYENTYNITATPTITADTNQYLASTGDTTDVSASIQTMLEQTGVCRLGPGDFYVSGIDMPSRTALIGCGQASRILLIGSNTTEGYAIRVGSECVLDGLNIWGSTSAGMTVSETIRERHGILFDGTADQQSPTTHYRVNVSNCWIKNFSGGGIVCKNTGYNSAACMNVSNVFIYYCNVGVYIPYFSEFHRFTNVHCGSCWYGCINNGGNNVFVNCNFSSNKLCFLMDNSDGNARNNSHGSVIGCVFDHANGNQGTGIKIVGCTNGEVFSGCQLFYADIEVENSKGIQFDNFNIGGGNCDIKITEGENAGLIIFNSCMFANGTYTLSGIVSPNNLVKLVNCWNTDGTAVTI